MNAFNKATGSLDSRLVPAMRRFRELGVGTDGIEEPAPLDVTTRQPSLLDGPEDPE